MREAVFGAVPVGPLASVAEGRQLAAPEIWRARGARLESFGYDVPPLHAAVREGLWPLVSPKPDWRLAQHRGRRMQVFRLGRGLAGCWRPTTKLRRFSRYSPRRG
jgi:hypothetical protein